MPQYQGIWTLAQAAQLQSTQRWATDPLFENTTLLLQADNAANGAQNNTFLDSSSNNFTITRNGNTTQGTFTPFSQSPGWWSGYFNSGAYISSSNWNNAGVFGTSDFTVECWVYAVEAVNSNQVIWSCNSYPNTTGLFLAYYGSTPTQLQISTGATALVTSSGGWSFNQWHHVAVTRSGTTLTLWINGVSRGSTTFANNCSDGLTFIGRPSDVDSFKMQGYISNLRITKSAALYTSSFSPPTTALTTTVASGTVSLLCLQSNRFVDNSSNAYTLTPNGSTTPSVQAFSPFAPQYQYTPSVTGGSGYFDGTGDYLTLPSSSNLAFGTGDFCVEFWLYRTGTTGGIYSNSTGQAGGDAQFEIQLNGTNKVILIGWNTIFMTGATTINANTWYHIAVVRSGTSMAIFVNGARDATATSANNFSSTNSFLVGQQAGGSGAVIGYISSLRAVKGSFVYNPSSTTVTIPTAPLTVITNTSLLLNFTNAGIYDGTLKNNLETVGNAQVSTSVVKYGTGSMYFDGTGDLLFSPASQNYSFPGDFTIECWINTSTISTEGGSYRRIFATGPDATTSLQLVFSDNVTTSGNVSVVTNVFVLIGTINAATGSWVHVALTRLGSSMRLFINGVQSGSTLTTTQAFTGGATNGLFVGSASGGTGRYLGYIDDFRITQGIARYTQNFTPPSVALPRQ